MPPRLKQWSSLISLPVILRPPGALARLAAPAQVRRIASDAHDREPGETAHEQQPREQPDAASDTSEVQGKAASPDTDADDAALSMIGDVPGPLELDGKGVNVPEAPTIGHKFPLPALPLPSKMHVKHRYDPILVQLTRLLMKDGKLSKAQRVSLATSRSLIDFLLTSISKGHGHDPKLPSHCATAKD
jgi:small subunit ribosomal protein S7